MSKSVYSTLCKAVTGDLSKEEKATDYAWLTREVDLGVCGSSGSRSVRFESTNEYNG